MQHQHQVEGVGLIVPTKLKSFGIFHAAPHLHVLGAQLAQCHHHVLRAHPLDENIRCEIAAHRNHLLDELANRHRCAEGAIHRGVAVIRHIQTVRRAIDNAAKFIFNAQRILEAEFIFCGLPKHFDHHRHFHGAGGVHHLPFIEKEFPPGFEIAAGDADFGMQAIGQMLQVILQGELKLGW
ncbi:MAG: hypothetical protein ALAOOOJD_02007 [bacterium]|nr:hypothetical protein [bacterium]